MICLLFGCGLNLPGAGSVTVAQLYRATGAERAPFNEAAPKQEAAQSSRIEAQGTGISISIRPGISIRIGISIRLGIGIRFPRQLSGIGTRRPSASHARGSAA